MWQFTRTCKLYGIPHLVFHTRMFDTTSVCNAFVSVAILLYIFDALGFDTSVFETSVF